MSGKFAFFNRMVIVAFALPAIAACTQSGSTVNSTLQPQATAQTGPQVQTAQSADGSRQITPNALAAETPQTSSPGLGDVAASTDGNAPAQVAALDPQDAVVFLPVEGAPQSASSALNRSLRTSAATQGLNILSPTQPGAKYQIKGYFSALSDGPSTLLVYVWDVLDASGKRIHRINGQERSATSSNRTDPWQSITDVEINRVADRTTSRLKSWIETRRG